MDQEPVGMRCPSCHQPPQVAFTSQAFCGNDECKIIQWNPEKTLDELLDDMGTVELPDFGSVD